jgi:hypothetical protein
MRGKANGKFSGLRMPTFKKLASISSTLFGLSIKVGINICVLPVFMFLQAIFYFLTKVNEIEKPAVYFCTLIIKHNNTS